MKERGSDTEFSAFRCSVSGPGVGHHLAFSIDSLIVGWVIIPSHGKDDIAILNTSTVNFVGSVSIHSIWIDK